MTKSGAGLLELLVTFGPKLLASVPFFALLQRILALLWPSAVVAATRSPRYRQRTIGGNERETIEWLVVLRNCGASRALRLRLPASRPEPDFAISLPASLFMGTGGVGPALELLEIHSTAAHQLRAPVLEGLEVWMWAPEELAPGDTVFVRLIAGRRSAEKPEPDSTNWGEMKTPLRVVGKNIPVAPSFRGGALAEALAISALAAVNVVSTYAIANQPLGAWDLTASALLNAIEISVLEVAVGFLLAVFSGYFFLIASLSSNRLDFERARGDDYRPIYVRLSPPPGTPPAASG